MQDLGCDESEGPCDGMCDYDMGGGSERHSTSMCECDSTVGLCGSMLLYLAEQGFGVTAADNYLCDGACV